MRLRSALALGLALALVACGKSGGGRAPCPAGQLCFEAGNFSEPFTLDPNKAQMVAESHLLYDMLIGLTTFDERGRTVPGMATSWDSSADGLTWRFHLRDAKWSDGMPVTANDFVASMRRLEDPRTASPYAYLLYLIQGAEAVNAGKAKPETMGVRALDRRTLEIKLTHPAPHLPLLFAHSSGMPVPAHAIARWGDAWVQPGHYVTNGAYALGSWALGDRIVLKRNPYYYANAQTCFDRVTYYPVTDLVSGERRVENGELDQLLQFASNRADYLRKRLPGYVQAAPQLGFYYVSFNTTLPAFADKSVRTALSMTVDRDFITTKLQRAGQIPLYGFVPPGMTGYTPMPKPIWASWSFERRKRAARALLARAGYGPANPLRFEFKFATSTGTVTPAAIQSDWRSIGVIPTLAPTEGQILFSELNAGAYEVSVDGWFADFDDPTTFLQLFTKAAGPQNHPRYFSPRFDGLMADADQELDAGRRMRILEHAERVAMADSPVAPLFVASSRNLINPAITGFRENVVDWHLKRFMCRKGVKRG